MGAAKGQTHLELGEGPNACSLSPVLGATTGRQSDGDIASVLKTRQKTI